MKKILSDVGYHADNIEMDALIHQQSPDIAKAVECSREKRCGLPPNQPGWENGAGDQGVMIGYACDETPQFLPMPVVLANRIVRELAASRRSHFIEGILPDGKAQVTVEYEDGRPVRLDSVVVSCQHTKDKNLKKLEQEIRNKVLTPALRLLPADEDTAVYINVREICLRRAGCGYRAYRPETDGGYLRKHCSAWRRGFLWKRLFEVDRSGAYMARYIAKNMVAAGLASRCQVSLAYAIGVAQPVMVQVDTFGTGKICADDCLAAAIPLVFALTPNQIIDTLRLKRPIFKQTAVYGHFGRKEFPWERTDKVEALRNTVM